MENRVSYYFLIKHDTAVTEFRQCGRSLTDNYKMQKLQCLLQETWEQSAKSGARFLEVPGLTPLQ